MDRKEIINKYHKKLAEGKKPTPEETAKYIESIGTTDDIEKLEPSDWDKMETISSSPAFRQYISEMQQANNKALRNDKIATGLNTIASIWDIGISTDQIQQANRSLKASRKPSRGRLPSIDPRIQSEIDRASEELYSPSFRELDPALQNIEQTYQGDLDQARTASAGQAGAYGAMGQAAALRRLDAGRQLVPFASQLRQGAGSRLAELLGMKESRQSQIDQISENRYAQDLDMYLNEQQAAGQLGAAGRQNLAASRNALLGNLTPLIGGVFDRFDDSVRGRKVGSGDDDIGLQDYEEYINNSLRGPDRYRGLV